MCPIDLGLLSGKHLKLQERFASLRAQAGNGAAQLHDASAVAAIANHLVNACGTQSGMLFQNEANKSDVGIDDRRPQRLRALETLALDGVPYGVGMDAQFRGNGADFPMFGVKVASNLRAGFVADHDGSHLRRGMRGNGSMNRPLHPQMQHRSRITGTNCGRGALSTPAVASDLPHWNDAGETIESEPSSVTRACLSRHRRR